MEQGESSTQGDAQGDAPPPPPQAEPLPQQRVQPVRRARQPPPPVPQPVPQPIPRSPPSPRSAPRTILKPRLVDWNSVDPMFHMLVPILSTQRWLKFMWIHKVYYPELVQEFYANMFKVENVFYTEVRGKLIELSLEMFHDALKLPYKGATPLTHPVDMKEAHLAMTEEDPEGVQVDYIQYNANEFPPLQRVLHHMFTTIIYPKGGSRELVNTVHKFLFYHLFKGVKVSLPSLMLDLMVDCARERRRSLPYANQLTAIFKLEEISLENEACVEIPLTDIYTRYKIETFMKFRRVHGVVQRVDEAGYVVGHEEEEEQAQEEEQEEEEEGNEGQGQEEEEAPAPPQHAENPDLYGERLDRMESRMANLENSLTTFGATMDTMARDIAEIRLTQNQMNQNFQTLNSHFESQAQFYSDFRRFLGGDPSQGPR